MGHDTMQNMIEDAHLTKRWLKTKNMKTQLNIVAGENIPYVKEAFGGLGNLRILPGRAITSADLNEANVLLIRSITQVNDVLLRCTSV